MLPCRGHYSALDSLEHNLLEEQTVNSLPYSLYMRCPVVRIVLFVAILTITSFLLFIKGCSFLASLNMQPVNPTFTAKNDLASGFIKIQKC